jgi:hypothetical protein
MEVFREVHQDSGEFAEFLGRQPKCIMGEVALRLGEYPLELPNGWQKIRVALPLIPLRTVR